MRVGIDLDGVVHDFHARYAELYQTWFGRELVGDRDDWDWILTQGHFKSYRELFDWFAHAGGWDYLPYVPGAPGAIDHLLTEGHSIAFITARQDEGAIASKIWHTRSPWYRSTTLVTNTKAKHTVPCSVYVDDGPHILEDLVDNEKNVVVFDRPWNRHLEKFDSVRALDWDDTLDLLTHMEAAGV